MADRRAFCGALLLTLVLLARSQAVAGTGTESCCACDCGGAPICLGATVDCAFECADFDECDVASSQVCAVGVFAGCDSECGAICNTPVPTPSQTATATATATVTQTPSSTATVTQTSTPVAIGGACMDTAQCAPGLVCVNNICSPTGAPASSPRGLAIAAGLLALIAAFALRRRGA